MDGQNENGFIEVEMNKKYSLFQPAVLYYQLSLIYHYLYDNILESFS